MERPAGRAALPAPGPRARRSLVGGRAGRAGSASCTRAVAARWDLDGAAGFELDLDARRRGRGRRPALEDVTSFPSVRQDLAVAVADDVPADRVLDTVRDAGGALLARAEVFDVYRGAQVGEGRASLALHLEFRAPDRTLTDEEVARPPREDRRRAARPAGR